MTSIYTHGHHESVLRAHRWRTAENSCAYLLPHLVPGMDLLDVGCGPASITLDLARHVGTSGRVVAIDPAADAVEAAREAVARAGVTNVIVEQADVESMADTAKDAFDVVHAHQVLQHVPDPVATLQAMRTTARPGGLVAAREADYGAMTWFPESDGLDEWCVLYRRVASSNGGRPDAGRELLSWATAAGFDDIVSSASAWCFATPEDREWWGGLWAERVTQSSIAEQAVAASLSTPSDLERLAAAWHSWAREDDGWFAVLHGEVLCGA